MKVQIRDRDALSLLPLRGLIFYLKRSGWRVAGDWGKRPASIYALEKDAQTRRVIVPHNDIFPDYPERMAEVVSTLAEVEERSQVEVYHDITETSYDVVRANPPKNVNGETPISLRQKVGLLKDAYDMVASSARAAENPQPVFRGGISHRVSDYLNLVHLPDASDINRSLTLYSPISLAGTLFEESSDASMSFSRRAILKLSEALDHANQAIEKVIKEDSLDAFQDAVSNGVSANLCEALASLISKWNGVVIIVSWGVESAEHVFSKNSGNILTDGAAHIRQRAPSLNENVVAWVIKLAQDPAEFDGRAVLLCERDRKPTQMHVVFEPESFQKVIKAFEKRHLVQVTGDIYKDGNRHELKNPRNLDSIPPSVITMAS